MITNSVNPLVVKTELDSVFWQFYQMPQSPGLATRESSEIFNQETLTNAAHIEAVGGGAGGYWTEKGQSAAPDQKTPLVANKVTYTAKTFAADISISREYFDDNMFGTWSNQVKMFAINGRATQEKEAFKLWRNAFTTQLTADGQAFISSGHVLIGGGTESNLLTGALSESTLNTAIISLMQQKSQDGIPMGMQPAVLLVPPALFKLACEITESALISDSAENAINVYSTRYQIKVMQSVFLGSAVGGSDKAWFVLSSVHAVTRYVREALNTSIVDWRYSTTESYVYRGRYREEYGVSDYIGVVGSTGL
jgi:hypothetical protein